MVRLPITPHGEKAMYEKKAAAPSENKTKDHT
jgi:hypothetical protein